ncbi:MAG TPA: SufD family Fe-S cluster assembly protein [Methanosarcinaceae archaeon]|nr:SufD family Fe-S cluster assembly protein [Methanosarcinaceae archaeon]
MDIIQLDTAKEFAAMEDAYECSGGDSSVLKMADVSNLVISGNKILSANQTEGVVLKKKSTESGVDIVLTIKKGHTIPNPVHLCFGVLPKEGLQQINVTMIAEEDASVELIAHCTFPNAEHVVHKMDGRIFIHRNASLRYNETHFHGDKGGVEVIPKAKVKIEEGGRYHTGFTLITGKVGLLDLDYEVDAGKDAICELNAKVYGKGNDKILIKEKVLLNGENARSVIKSRVAISDNAFAEFTGVTEGHAPYARGHVDCVEVVQGNAVAKAVPIVMVDNPLAKVTHEAAIGSVDKKQVDTLMARGLDESEAIDAIVKGMLK